ncbi:MAG TPA: poly(3-hydroxybutyrate) depolymerase [Gammaproteobacteria bacterium]|nr:poly(3-hydroxybutyrate) depolymerase [Gammaproteobacteria bacterium]
MSESPLAPQQASKSRLNWRLFSWVLIGFAIGIPLAGFIYYQSLVYSDDELVSHPYGYPGDLVEKCDGHSLVGPAGRSHHRSNTVRVAYEVRTPINYQANYAHPLLMVYAPSGLGPGLNEKFTGLTSPATQAGYIVVYVGSRRLNVNSVKALGTISHEVAKGWCIDEERVFLTGHSDGGTMSHLLAILAGTPLKPTALAPSAAGMNEQGFAPERCPEPTSVMIMHNKGDGHFPEYGADAAHWWAVCNQCRLEPIAHQFPHCVQYPQCANEVTTLYCEGEGGHLRWPRMEQEIVDFFNRQSRRSSSSLILSEE